MRDEVKKNRNRPRQLNMPLLSTPTRTVHSHITGSGKAPAITSAIRPASTEFALGADTCGYTSGSTITCDAGYECTNVGTYRGCCDQGGSDCASTIHTSCIDYGQVANSAQCGPHTLCCPWSAASCFSYAFTTDAEPDATFTYVQCQESRGFGEMYPEPLDLSLTADGPSRLSSGPLTSLTVQPDNHPSSRSTSAGAIAGAVCGAIAFICLVIAAAYILMHRRRQQKGRRHGAMATVSTEPSRLKGDPPEAAVADGAGPGAGNQRTLSTIHENRSSAGPPLREKRKSSFPRIQSLNPGWPLGANGNPLASHPVDLEKRLSRNTPSGDKPEGPRPPSQQIPREQQQQGVPILKVPTPPPGTRLAPPPPPPKSPRNSTSDSPTSTGAKLKSPRLTYVPVSPIEAAFDDEMSKRKSWYDDSSETHGSSSTRNSYSGSMAAPRALTPRAPALSLQGLSNTSATDFAAVGAAADPEPVSPVSPLDGDGEDEDIDTKRISFISAPSAPGEGDREMDELVSPISPNEPGSGDGRESPETVSPMESRQGSLRGR
ncbi:hypothetical protein F4810DRAFT_330809 [Camillea tinctor]|nr:hypothetical protein F4810DRAFT_330809 [Camillea tinctor]